jgi:RimJ/RimL family protein N-acetyltransferase
MANIILENVILRTFEKSDIDQLHKFRNDKAITGSLGGFSTGNSREAIDRKINSWEQHGNTMIWAVALKENDLCIGHIGLYDIDYVSRKAEVGMLIGEQTYWGKGIGFAITEAIVEFAFAQLNLHNIQARVLENNLASLRVFEKLGFKKDGILRDFQYRDGHYINAFHLAILENEWSNLTKDLH